MLLLRAVADPDATDVLYVALALAVDIQYSTGLGVRRDRPFRCGTKKK